MGRNERASNPEKDLIDSFIHNQSSRHTRRAYRRDLETLFGQSTVTAEVVRSIDPGEIDRLIQQGESEGLSVSTLRRRLSAIRRFYDWLTAESIARQNPARHGSIRKPMKRPDSPSEQTPETRRSAKDTSDGHTPTLTRKQAESIVRALDTSTRAGRRDRAMLQLILHCALRRSEVVAVNTTDFRLVGPVWVMDVYSAQSSNTNGQSENDSRRNQVSGRFRQKETLSERSKVPDHVLGHVEAVRMDLGGSRGALFRSLSNQNRGSRLTGDAVYRIVRSAGQRAAIENVTPDRLRQTGLQLAIENGATVDQARAHGRYTPNGPFQKQSRREERLRSSAADYVQIGVDL